MGINLIGCGMKLRASDPTAMKQFIVMIQSRVNELEAESKGKRVRSVISALIAKFDSKVLMNECGGLLLFSDGIHARDNLRYQE